MIRQKKAPTGSIDWVGNISTHQFLLVPEYLAFTYSVKVRRDAEKVGWCPASYVQVNSFVLRVRVRVQGPA